MLFHRSGTFSWPRLMALPFHQLRWIYSIYVKCWIIHVWRYYILMSDLLLITVSFLLFLMRYFFKLGSILTESIKTLIQTTLFGFLIWLLEHGVINRLSLDPRVKCWHLALTSCFLTINVLSPWLPMNSPSWCRWLDPHKGHTIRFIELLFSFMVDMLHSWLLISCIEGLMFVILIIR